MTTLVLTVIGDDRSGLVSSLSEVIAAHDGNWTTSRMSELAGKFAGIVLVEVDPSRVEDLTRALEPLSGLFEITAQPGRDDAALAGERLQIELVGDDHPGIVHQVTDAIHRSGGSIETLTTGVTEAPMAGGLLFTANATVRIDGDERALRTALEDLAQDLMVEFSFGR
ncbi:glycine cleavage system protein R [Microbacterium sp. ZW T5_56]|uniref:glycine cleavage system protein R n=1 Tax=Microbacterium sp. ZW T5_56 TaxID=3378081 RepID=UPI003851A450